VIDTGLSRCSELEDTWKGGENMLSLELIGIFGLLFAFVIYVMVVTQLERRSLRKGAEKTAETPAGVAHVQVEE
jgi:hypothetical protein